MYVCMLQVMQLSQRKEFQVVLSNCIKHCDQAAVDLFNDIHIKRVEMPLEQTMAGHFLVIRIHLSLPAKNTALLCVKKTVYIVT